MSTQENPDTAPPPFVRYYTQHRQIVAAPGNQPYDTGWQIACNGHTDQISAIACHDLTKQHLENAAKQALCHAPVPGGQIGKLQVRIVKITSTTEIVEEATDVEVEAR